jgi:endonuclease-3
LATNKKKPTTLKAAPIKSKPILSKASKKSTTTKVELNFVLKKLKIKYPDAHCALNFTNPFELLVATILSAQCTDERVNKVTPELFKNFGNPKAMSLASIEEIEELVRSTGFFKNKAKSLKTCAEQLVEKHEGKVPKTMEELYALPGVGRKTANVVLGNAFNIASGVVVDTHVTRLANRFGWVKEQDAVKIESHLNKVCPQEDWIMLSHYLISHGRAICVARSPKCLSCFLNEACPKRGV